MKNFTYYTPTKVVFGKDTEDETGSLIRAFNGNRILIVYGGGSAIKSGLISRIEKSLDKENLFHISTGGVKPNPRLAKVKEVISLANENSIDFLLAVGGGSVIDTCKAAGLAISSPGLDVWDVYDNKVTPKSCTPVGVVLTISAAGSEMSNSSVITNEDTGMKKGVNLEIIRPKFAVMNPALTCTLPDYQTASGCVDIMMHTMERYFHNEEPAEITDGIAEALMRDVIKYACVLSDDPMNYNARAEIMWCGSLSHNGLTSAGGSLGDWSCHQMEHVLGAVYDVAHGAGLAAIWPSWARYVYHINPKRFAAFAVRVMGVVPESSDTDESIAEKGILAVEDFYHRIHMPVNLRELGVAPSDEDFAMLAAKCTYQHTRTIGVCGIMELKEDDIEKIYRASV